jgi:hypothetical protein
VTSTAETSVSVEDAGPMIGAQFRGATETHYGSIWMKQAVERSKGRFDEGGVRGVEGMMA